MTIHINIGNRLDEAWMLLRICAVALWRLPVLRCPACHGDGGRMSGYYEPEWDECEHCWPPAKWLIFYDQEWAIGRIHPLRWPRVRLAVRTGHRTFSGWIACRLGWHRPNEYGTCRRCYEEVAPR